DRQSALPQEIKQIEQQVDRIEQDALATIPSLAAGNPQRLLTLGKLLFYDKALSVNRNEACAFCHMPQTGFQGAIESLNKGGVAQPGSLGKGAVQFAEATKCRLRGLFASAFLRGEAGRGKVQPL